MNDLDRFFDESLAGVGRRGTAPDGPSPDVRARCMAQFAHPRMRGRHLLRRPAVLSTLGVIAVIATASGLLFPTNGGPVVRAATVLEKLSKQAAGADLIQVDLDKVAVDEILANGNVYLTDKAVAGDVQVTVSEDEGAIEVDVSFAVTNEGGWVLVRKIRMPDPKVQVFIDMFLPSGIDTLIKIPGDLVREELEEGFDGKIEHIQSLASGQVAAFAKMVLESKSSAGATTQKLPDGTVRISIETDDAATLRNLIEMVAAVAGEDGEHEVDVDDTDVEELLGTRLAIVYDPKTESVRSFSITGIHGIAGVITVSLQGGEIAHDLLDSARVTGPKTRVLDLGALLQSADGLKQLIDRHHD